jgi:RNA polymerase sigma-70 factor (ECF subfamily)
MTKSLEPYHERDIVARADHDPEAFRTLYRHHLRRVYAYISYRVGRVQDAEDLTAETFLKAVEGLPGFEWRGAGSFAAWLFRIAHNVVGNFYRAGDRMPASFPPEALPDVPACTELPADALDRKELFAHLRRLITTLSPRQQEVVTLRFFGGLRNQEIAMMLELDERTVAAHLCRGIRKLQRRYEEAAIEQAGVGITESEAVHG